MRQSQEVRAGFERWSVFEKARQANRMRHRQAHEALARLLAGRGGPPVAVLDVGCGDARDMARTLAAARVRSYLGLDNDPTQLEAARQALSPLGIPCRFVCAGYETALEEPAGTFDLIWLGLFLHHLPDQAKAEFLARVHALLTSGGVLVAHDPALFDNETRQDYLRRLAEHCRRDWNELTPQEKDILTPHWERHGHQQSVAEVDALARAAGFDPAETLWSDPDRFYAVTAWRK